MPWNRLWEPISRRSTTSPSARSFKPTQRKSQTRQLGLMLCAKSSDVFRNRSWRSEASRLRHLAPCSMQEQTVSQSFPICYLLERSQGERELFSTSLVDLECVGRVFET